MVDNFDLIKQHLNFANEGDCYYVQLLCRPCNIQTLSEKWKTKHPDIDMYDVHKDNPTILYCVYGGTDACQPM